MANRGVLLDAELPARPVAAAGFAFSGDAMRRRGGPPRKDAPRKRNGRLRHVTPLDRGHEITLQRRAALTSEAGEHDQRAGYPLGILAMRGELADPGANSPDDAAEENRRRHQAGLMYAGLHAVVYGVKSPRSHMAALLTGLGGGDGRGPDNDRAGSAARLRETVEVVVSNAGRRGFDVLENIVVYERPMRFMDTAHRRTEAAWEADRRDKAALRGALAALVRLFKLEPGRER